MKLVFVTFTSTNFRTTKATPGGRHFVPKMNLFQLDRQTAETSSQRPHHLRKVRFVVGKNTVNIIRTQQQLIPKHTRLLETLL